MTGRSARVNLLILVGVSSCQTRLTLKFQGLNDINKFCSLQRHPRLIGLVVLSEDVIAKDEDPCFCEIGIGIDVRLGSLFLCVYVLID